MEGRGGLRGRRVPGVLELVASDALEAVVGGSLGRRGRAGGLVRGGGKSKTIARGNVLGFFVGF